MKIALLYNAKPEVAPEGLPDDTYEEYDGPQVLEAIAAALAPHEVVPVLADRRLPWRLEEGRFDFAFNIAEGEGRRSREAVPAAVCELLGLPYTGSDPLTLAVTLDKGVACRLVSPDVPVPRGVVVADEAGEAQLEGLAFPVLVKPNDEGSSKGIRDNPVAEDLAGALRRVRWLREVYGCPARVEEFLPGVELTVGVAGNGPSARVIGVMEIAPAQEEAAPFVYSLEVKRDWRNRVRYHVPPRLPAATLAEVEALALRAFALLGCRDLSRFDFRLDAQGRPRFIECNPLPGLNPETGDIAILSRSSMSYVQLVGGVLEAALSRQGR